MATLYSTVLLRAKGSSGASAIVPAGFVWVVREISVWFGGTLGSAIEIDLLPDHLIVYSKNAPSGGGFGDFQERRIVMPAGGGNGLRFTTGDTWDVIISGYQLKSP